MGPILPPLIAIALAFITRQVHLSLFIGILSAAYLMGGAALAAPALAIEQVVDVFRDPSNTRVVLFCVLIGGFLALVQANGGVRGFADWIERSARLKSRRAAEIFVFFAGCVVFIESTITIFVAASVGRPLFARLRLAKEKLAYYCDATSAPICMLFPLNAWGVFVLGLLADEEEPLRLLLSALPLAFYPIFALLIAFAVAVFGIEIGPMKAASERALAEDDESADRLIPDEVEARDGAARRFLLPLVLMVALVPFGLFITGDGNFFAGKGSAAVLYAVLGGSLAAGLFHIFGAGAKVNESIEIFFEGSSKFFSLGALMALAFAFGEISRALGTGPLIASMVSESLPPGLTVMLVFFAAALIAFATGTSWGTMALTIPLALPVAHALGLPPALLLGASLSGSVFGDHASPISDTTIVSAMAAGCEPMDHVKTQLPYALIGAGMALVMYGIAGALV